MNRSNIGNIITNAAQIGAVSATTASRMFRKGHAEDFLNNLTEEDMSKYKKMKSEKKLAEIEAWEKKKLETKESEEKSVDKLMEDAFKEQSLEVPKVDSPQGEQLSISIARNQDWEKFWTHRDIGVKKFIKKLEDMEE